MEYTAEQLNGWAQQIEKHQNTVAVEGLDPLWAILQLRAHAALIEREKKLQRAIRWALGYDEGDPQFGEQEGGPGMYSWRKELRRRAENPKEPPDYFNSPEDLGDPFWHEKQHKEGT